MVALTGFFSGGVVKQANRRRELETDSEKVKAFKQEARRKTEDARLKQKLDEITRSEKRITAFDALALEAGNSPGLLEAVDRERRLIGKLRIGMGQSPESADDISTINRAVARAGPVTESTTLQRSAEFAAGGDENAARALAKENLAKADKLPTVASMSAPFIKILSEGGTLTPGQQAALDALQRLGPFDQLLRNTLQGAGTGGTTPQTPTAPEGFVFVETRKNVHVFRRKRDGKTFEVDRK